MATIFGLCLATISLRGMYAAELRVSFVLLAIFVVCLIDLGLFVYQRILRFKSVAQGDLPVVHTSKFVNFPSNDFLFAENLFFWCCIRGFNYLLQAVENN